MRRQLRRCKCETSACFLVNPAFANSQAITNTEREELWQDFLRDKEKREREAKRAVRRERAAAFRDLLLSTPSIKVRKHSDFLFESHVATNAQL